MQTEWVHKNRQEQFSSPPPPKKESLKLTAGCSQSGWKFTQHFRTHFLFIYFFKSLAVFCVFFFSLTKQINKASLCRLLPRLCWNRAPPHLPPLSKLRGCRQRLAASHTSPSSLLRAGPSEPTGWGGLPRALSNSWSGQPGGTNCKLSSRRETFRLKQCTQVWKVPWYVYCYCYFFPLTTYANINVNYHFLFLFYTFKIRHVSDEAFSQSSSCN